MVAVNRIVYNGMSNIDLNTVCDVAFNSDDGETSTYLSREAVSSETYRGEFTRVYNYKYSEVLSTNFTFVKSDFTDFTLAEQRRVLTWLTSKQTPSFCAVYYDDSNAASYELLGAFTEIKTYKLSNGRTIGITAVFESTSPWGFSYLKCHTIDMSDPTDAGVTISIEADEMESAVYPCITIQQDNVNSVVEIAHPMTDNDEWVMGTVYHYDSNYYWKDTDGVKHTSSTNTSDIDTTGVVITNTHTNDSGDVQTFISKIKNNIKGEEIVVDGANKVISSSRINGRIFGDDFSWNWIPLFDGTNVLSFEGAGTVTVQWREPIKCGEF